MKTFVGLWCVCLLLVVGVCTATTIQNRFANVSNRLSRTMQSTASGVRPMLRNVQTRNTMTPRIKPQRPVALPSYVQKYPFLTRPLFVSTPSTQSIAKAALARALGGSYMFAQERIGAPLYALSQQLQDKLSALRDKIKAYGTASALASAAYKALQYRRYFRK